MILFRQHRGGLEESMATVREVDSLSQLVDIIREDDDSVSAESIKIAFMCFDNRTGWDTYVVTTDNKAVGFTNGKFDDQR